MEQEDRWFRISVVGAGVLSVVLVALALFMR
jgi:hypothetical protein